jgi:hypothetical protein
MLAAVASYFCSPAPGGALATNLPDHQWAEFAQRRADRRAVDLNRCRSPAVGQWVGLHTT